MTAKIGFDNFARRAEAPATASASASSVGTSPSRLLTDDLSECWRSIGSSAWIQIDLDGPEEIDTVALVGTNLLPSAEWRVRIGTGDLTNAGNVEFDSGTVVAGIVDPWGLAVAYLTEAATGESIRIDLEDTELEQIEVPRVWITKSWSPARWYSFDWEQRAIDYSTVTRGQYGSVFTNVRPITRGYALQFKAMNTADRTEVRRIQRLCGSSREILLCLDEQSEVLGEDTLLVMPTSQPIVRNAVDLWSWSLDCEERI